MNLSDFTGRQWRVLLILMLVNFVNYVDRQIVFALFPYLRHDFGLTRLQLGTLATAFTVVLSLASFPLGMLADRISRRAVISAGILFWSGATFFSGLASSFHTLLVARGMVGIGEAAYTPAGAAVITAAFPKDVRARVQGSFDIGMFIGGATGISLGGYIAAQFGWRAAFFMVGIPGVILGLAALRLPESVVTIAKESMSVFDLLRVPAFLALLVSGFFCSFAGYSYVVWGPDLVHEKGFSAAQASMALGLTIVLGGMLGIATGAYLSDLLAKLRAWGRAAIVPIGFVLAAPAIYFALYASNKIHFLLLFGMGAFLPELVPRAPDRHHPRPGSAARTCDGSGLLLFVRQPVFHGHCTHADWGPGGPSRADLCPARSDHLPTDRSGVLPGGDSVHSARRSPSPGTGTILGRRTGHTNSRSSFSV